MFSTGARLVNCLTNRRFAEMCDACRCAYMVGLGYGHPGAGKAESAGNIRLIDRLMMQVEHILVANQLQVVTKEVVETARQNLIIGPEKGRFS